MSNSHWDALPTTPRVLLQAPTPRLDASAHHAVALQPPPRTCRLTAQSSPCQVELVSRDIAPLAVPAQALPSGLVWRNCRLDACGQYVDHDEVPVQLRYFVGKPPAGAFPASALPAHAVLSAMSQEEQQSAEAAFREVSRFANLRFAPALDADRANILLAHAATQANTTLDPGQPLGGSTLTLQPNATGIFVTQGMYQVVAHEVAHAVGRLKHPTDPRWGGVTLPQDGWPDVRTRTLLSYKFPWVGEGTQDNSTLRYGPLDLEAFAFLYGIAPTLRGDTVHEFNASFGWGALHDNDGDNTLKVRASGAVNVTLRTDGTPSLADGAVLRLSPSSTFVTGNISATGGGLLQGNALDNRLIGSEASDVLATGEGVTAITLGGGRDVVFVNVGATRVNVTDFDVAQDTLVLAWTPTLLAQQAEGDSLRVEADNVTVWLAGSGRLPTGAYRVGLSLSEASALVEV